MVNRKQFTANKKKKESYLQMCISLFEKIKPGAHKILIGYCGNMYTYIHIQYTQKSFISEE